jgi:hypothetical protein
MPETPSTRFELRAAVVVVWRSVERERDGARTGGEGLDLSVCLLAPWQNGSNVHSPVLVVERKNNAVPAYALPVPACQLPPFERDNVSMEWIGLKRINGTTKTPLDIAWNAGELPFGFVREFNAPRHV